MAENEPTPDYKNILAMNFGQMGDVILSLPALSALRAHFPDSDLTVMTGKPGAAVVEASSLADEQIVVDRVALRDGKKVGSIAEIIRIIGEVRRRRFDLIVDLHSLSETNLLGFVSGAKARLYANRENRSLDRLGRFRERPPVEDKSLHLTDRYLDVLKPLGIANARRDFTLDIAAPLRDSVGTRLFAQANAETRKVGFAVGAGNVSRRWPLERFAELAGRLAGDSTTLAVFLGPEEVDLRPEVESSFPPGTVIADSLSIKEFMAAASMLDVMVANDSGPAHIAAIAGTAIVMIMDSRGPLTYLPLAERLEVVNGAHLAEISVSDVLAAAKRILA